MKFFAAIFLLASSAQAFVPSMPSPVQACSVALDAKHANNKAAKKSNHDHPRKSRPSDINRKPTNYPKWENPPEYTILEE
ncbi:hypothetical protein HJC23_013718 [Cyclotella cryptica]|uniref:Uncharacterized protein n=1 Tax=Cyclotella cryptica TaxID=29204 RepID=A0ABD3QVH9_9STRA